MGLFNEFLRFRCRVRSKLQDVMRGGMCEGFVKDLISIITLVGVCVLLCRGGVFIYSLMCVCSVL